MVFFLPPVASVILFLFLWREGILPRPHMVGACVLVGLVGQLLAPVYSPTWFAASLLTVGVAIYLAILLKLSL
jgi:hypothetical protein